MLIALMLHNKTIPDDPILSPPKLLVAIMSAPWDAARRAMAQQTCSAFKSQNIDCRLFDAVDMRSVHRFEDDANIQYLVEAKGVLNRQFVEEHWESGRGKVGHTVTFLLMMEQIHSIFVEDKAFDYFLFLEDDAIIPDIPKFTDQLIGRYLSTVHHHGIFSELDAIHLSRSRCDNPWFRWMAFSNPNGNDIGLWENRSGALSRFWMGTTAIVFSRKWIDQTMAKCLDQRPIDYFTDIWMSRFIVDGTLKMYTVCPNMVQEANEKLFPSVIHGSTSYEDVVAKTRFSHPYFWAQVWDTIICILYTISAMGMVGGGIGGVCLLARRWFDQKHQLKQQ